MSLKSKIEAVIYASEEPVTLQQLVGLLAEETDSELRALDAMQTQLPLDEATGEAGRGANQDADRIDRDNVAAAAQAEIVDKSSSTSTGELKSTSIDGEHTVADDAATVVAEAKDETSGEEASVVDGTPDVSERAISGQATSEPATDPRVARERDRQVREYLRRTIDTLIHEYAESDRGIEIREVAGGFRMGTKPEYHDAVRGFVKSLKPALKLTLQALETLAVVAYKQPVTAAEISEIRGVDSGGVLGGLIGRKLIATAGRKQVIGRPMLYKTTKEFLVRFGLKDVHELPSMEEFERLAGELNEQDDLPMEPTEAIIERINARGDADHIREATEDVESTGPDASEETGANPAKTQAEVARLDPDPSPEQDAMSSDDSKPDADQQTTPTTNHEPSAP